MKQKQSNIFNGSAVQYFNVPHSLVGNKLESPLRGMSHNCLRLALVIYSKANRDWSPVVTLNRADIVKRAGINKQAVVKTVNELGVFHLAQVVNRKGVYTFTLLDPDTRRTLPSLNETVKDGVLTEDQVLTLTNALDLGRMDDARGTMRFICPCHFSFDSHGRKKGKNSYLNISHKPTGWIWQCTFPPCRLHGKRRTQVVKDDYGEYKAEVVVGGGGKIVDLVAAMINKRSEYQHPVTQQEAMEEMNRLLGRNQEGCQKGRLSNIAPS